MTVAVASGVIAWEGTKANVTAGNLTLTADGTNPRFYLIVASSAGVKSAVAGTPAPEMDDGVRGPAWPAIPASSIVLASVYIPAADTDIDANQIDDVRVFVVSPEPTTNYDLAKARSIPLVKERSETVTLDTGQNQIHAFTRADSRIFASTRTSPAWRITLNDPEDLTNRTATEYAADGFHDRGESAVYVNGKIYLLFGHASRTTIAEIDPATLSTTDVVSDTSNPAGTLGAICSDGTHLYVVTSTSPSKVLKYRLSDFGLAASATLTSLNTGHAIIYDGTELFASGNSNPGWVARVNPSDLTFASAATAGQCTDDLVSVGDYLFVGQEFIGVSLVRVEKANLATQESVHTAANQIIYGLHYDGQSVWASYATTPGQLTRVNPNTLEASSYTFPTGENEPNELLSDGTGRLFVTFWMSPAKVKRLVPLPFPVPQLLSTSRIQLGTSTTYVPLSTVRGVSHVAVGNDTGSEKTLLSSTIPANTLNADGRVLRVIATGRFAANAAAKRILIKFGLGSPVTVFDTGSLLFNDAQWWLEAVCVRTGASAQDWVTKWTSDSSLLATDVQHSTTTQADTASINILIRGVGVSANDTIAEFLSVEALN